MSPTTSTREAKKRFLDNVAQVRISLHFLSQGWEDLIEARMVESPSDEDPASLDEPWPFDLPLDKMQVELWKWEKILRRNLSLSEEDEILLLEWESRVRGTLSRGRQG